MSLNHEAKLLSRIRVRWRHISWVRRWHNTSVAHRSCLVPFIELIVKAFRLQFLFKTHKGVERFVLICLAIELLIFFFFPYLSSYNYFVVIALVLVVLRLLNIFGAWMDILIITTHGKIASAPRLLLLTLINYVEVGIIFAIIAFTNRHAFVPYFEDILRSLRWSFDVLIPTIEFETNVIQPVSFCGNAIFFSEVAFGFIFLIVIVARLLSFFRREG